MDSIETDIEIRAAGGADAADQINLAAEAINRTSASSSALQEQFQHRFQHIGLQLFAGDALRASGLGRETRTIINSLNLALTEGAAAAGISSGGILLLVAALGALAAIAVKVIGHQKDMTESLLKQAQADSDTVNKTTEKVNALRDYAEAVGKLPPELQTLLAAEQRVAADQTANLKGSVAAATEALRLQTAAMVHHIETTNMWKGIWAGLVEGTETFLKSTINVASFITAHAIPTWDAWAAASRSLMSAFSGVSTGVYMSQAQFETLKQKTDQNIASQKELAFQAAHAGMTIKEWAEQQAKAADKAAQAVQHANDALVTHTTSALNRLSSLTDAYNAEQVRENATSFLAKNKQTEAWYQKNLQALTGIRNAEEQAIAKSKASQATKTSQEIAMMQHYHDAVIALNADAAAKMKTANDKAWDDFKKASTSALDDVNKYMGDSFAQMIVSGQSMTESLDQFFSQMAERFISMVIQMIIEWAALKAIMMIFGGPGIAGFQATATAAYPGVAQTGYSEMSTFAAATGFNGQVDRPTMFLAGEAGPESVNIQPLSGSSGSGGGGGGGDMYVGPITVNANGVQDPKRFADQVGQEIVRSIRGQGQLNFTRQ